MADIFEIAVQDNYKLVAIPLSLGIGNMNSFKPTAIESSTSKVGDKAVLTKEIRFEIVSYSCTMPGFIHMSVNNITPIRASAKKCSADGNPCLLKLDMGDCTGTFQNPSTGATAPCTCKIMIQEAGQTLVKGL